MTTTLEALRGTRTPWGRSQSGGIMWECRVVDFSRLPTETPEADTMRTARQLLMNHLRLGAVGDVRKARRLGGTKWRR